MITVIENLNSYLLDKYNLEGIGESEVKEMVKSFYDPKVGAKGIEKGIEEGIVKGEIVGIEKGIKFVAENIIKDGDSVEKIKRNTGLSEKQINELKRLLEVKGEH